MVCVAGSTRKLGMVATTRRTASGSGTGERHVEGRAEPRAQVTELDGRAAPVEQVPHRAVEIHRRLVELPLVGEAQIGREPDREANRIVRVLSGR